MEVAQALPRALQPLVGWSSIAPSYSTPGVACLQELGFYWCLVAIIVGSQEFYGIRRQKYMGVLRLGTNAFSRNLLRTEKDRADTSRGLERFLKGCIHCSVGVQGMDRLCMGSIAPDGPGKVPTEAPRHWDVLARVAVILGRLCYCCLLPPRLPGTGTS